MNGGIWRAAGGSRILSLGESTALSQDIEIEIGQPSLSYKRRKRAIKDILRKPKTR